MSDSTFYYGCSENRINSKGQVSIPARLRSVISSEELQQGYVLIRGEGLCLYMYSHKQFASIKDNARRIAEDSGDSNFFRQFMSEAYPIDLDPQGRFVLPLSLREQAKIINQAVLFVGVDSRIELWDPVIFSQLATNQVVYEKTREKVARQLFGI